MYDELIFFCFESVDASDLRFSSSFSSARYAILESSYRRRLDVVESVDVIRLPMRISSNFCVVRLKSGSFSC